MVFSRRILSLVIVPLMSLAIFRLYSRETFLAFQDAIHRSATDTLLGRILPRSLPPRSEIPLYVTSQTHWSHIEKVTAIALGLAELGYPVTFITGRVFEDYVTSLHPNIKFSAMLGLDDKMSEKDMATYMSLPSGVDQEIFIMKKVLVDGTDDGHDTLQAQFREFRTKYGNHKPLISLYDQTCSGHFPILLGSPGIRPDASIGISLAPLAIDSNDTFPFMSGKPPYPGPNAQEVHNRAYKDRFESRLTRELNEYWWAKLKVLGVERESYPVMTNAMNAIPDYLLTLGIPQFEFPRSDLRPNVRYFGAFRKVGKSGEEPKLPDWWHDLVLAKEQGKKIIAVSQGTVEVRPEDLVLPTLEALKDDEDVLVVATFVVTEPEEVPGLVVPENARVAKFVPYDQLLPMVDVLVSNGGYGAVQHCLRLGIPMVVSGQGQDKADTNAIVDYTGVGINIGVRQPGSKKIKAAVEKILNDQEYRLKAQEMSKHYESYDVGKVFDETIQQAVKRWQKQQKATNRGSKKDI